MNPKARELGMNDTHYVEPTGLSSRNQSSAHDLATLVKAAHEHQIIRELSTSPEYQVEVGNRDAPVPQHQRPGASSPAWDIGLQKTGYISEAGRCLVMQAKMAGRKLIMVFLDSAGKYSRIGDAERVRRWVTESVPHAQARRRAGGGRRRSADGPTKPPKLTVPEPSALRQRRGARAPPKSAPQSPAARSSHAFLQTVGRRRDRQAGDELALVVEDAGGHAAHARARAPRRRAPSRTD